MVEGVVAPGDINSQNTRYRPMIGRGRRDRGWRFVLIALSAAGVFALAALLLDKEPRAVFFGLSIVSVAVAAYCVSDILLLTRSGEPIEPGEDPTHTPLPQSPVTLIHDPRSTSDTTLERTHER
jgi:hypothetical protein